MTTLFAATGDGIARIDEHDGAWDSTITVQGNGAQCLALHPRDPHTLFAGTSGHGVWISDDGGQTWRDADFPQPDVFSLAVSPVDGTVYAGCEPSMLFRSGDGGRTWHELSALREIPSAPTWSFPPRPWTSHVRWIAPNLHDAALLLVGIELGGLMYSRDGGATWSDHRPNAQRDVHALAWHPTVPGRAYEAGGGGTAWSRDGGWTWERVDAGRDRHYTWALAPDPDDPDCWYVSANPGPHLAHQSGVDAQAHLYRWRGEGPWEPLGGGLPEPLTSMPYALAALPGRLFTGLRDGRLYASADRGDTWQQLQVRGDRLPSILALTVSA